MKMDALKLLLDNHAWVHSRPVTPDGMRSIEDELCEGLTEQQLRQCPRHTHNSIAWLLWHMARYEDVAVNSVLRGVTEVLDRDNWLARLGLDRRQAGTEDTPEDVKLLSEQIDIGGLRAYRAAVGQETRTWLVNLNFQTLDALVTREDVGRAVDRGTFGERAAWVIEYWEQGWSRGEFLSWLLAGHNFIHLGEARVTRSLVLLEY
jgi:hypothetical protein